MGIVYADMGQHAEAITAIERVAQLDPTGETGQTARKTLRLLRGN